MYGIESRRGPEANWTKNGYAIAAAAVAALVLAAVAAGCLWPPADDPTDQVSQTTRAVTAVALSGADEKRVVEEAVVEQAAPGRREAAAVGNEQATRQEPDANDESTTWKSRWQRRSAVRVAQERLERLAARGDAELLRKLETLHVPEINASPGHEAAEGWSIFYDKVLETLQPKDAKELAALYADRVRREGLPQVTDERCRTPEFEARTKAFVAGRLRRRIKETKALPSRTGGSYSELSGGRDVPGGALAQYLRRYADAAEAPSISEQMLQVEAEPYRLALVRLLATTPGEESTQILARRAVFDLSADVRRAAVEELRTRLITDPVGEREALEQVRSQFTAALRYPWPPPAEHAAVALAELNDTGAVDELVELLDEPNPAAPFEDEDGRWKVRELVRANHRRNCLLCHPPTDRSERVFLQGVVPLPGKEQPPLPPSTSLYYRPAPSVDVLIVRADITRLRQDFSLRLSTDGYDPWPTEQRFDYFVRTRPLGPDETAQAVFRHTPTKDYPHRKAVLAALRVLTGHDAGTTSEAWRAWLGREKALAFR